VNQCENRITDKVNNKQFLLYVITVRNRNSYFEPFRVQCTSVQRPATRQMRVQFPVEAWNILITMICLWSLSCLRS